MNRSGGKDPLKEKQKTLYVSDLDGTLMRNDETISPYTVRTINELVGRGLAFTYATARSVESARATSGVCAGAV